MWQQSLTVKVAAAPLPTAGGISPPIFGQTDMLEKESEQSDATSGSLMPASGM